MMRYEYAMAMEATDTPLVEKRVQSRRRRLLKQSRTSFMYRIKLISLILMGILLATMAGSLVMGPSASAADEIGTITITVGAGDSLWSIAAKYGDPDQDTRTTIREIEQLNEIERADNLFPGMTLEVPDFSDLV